MEPTCTILCRRTLDTVPVEYYGARTKVQTSSWVLMGSIGAKCVVRDGEIGAFDSRSVPYNRTVKKGRSVFFVYSYNICALLSGDGENASLIAT